jgi:conjugal transfer/type IV secretion protein DotA/TraY
MNTKWLGTLFLDVLLPWRPVIKSAKLLSDQAKMSVQAAGRFKAFIKEAYEPTEIAESENKSFAEALTSDKALPLETLEQHFLLRKRLALGLGGLFLGIAAIGYLTSAYRFNIAGMGIAALSAVGSGITSFFLALSAHFRLWQLRTQRLSREERGSFKDFRREERDWILQVISPEIGISKRTLQMLFIIPIMGSLITVGTAWAQGMTLGEISAAAKSTTDLSRQALIGIFGQVVNDPLANGASGGGDTILARIFQIGNAALLSVALVIGGWMAFKKVSGAAHDGTVFEQGKATLWGPIRAILAIASLAPTANGWSICQLLMLWAASIMGVGTANLATRAATDALTNGQTMVVQPVMPSTVELARNLYQANLCMYAVNQGLDLEHAQGGWVMPNYYIQPHDTQTGMIFRSSTYVCGGANVTDALESANQVKDNTGWFSSNIDVSDIKKAHLEALRAMQKVLYPGAQDFARKVAAKMQNGAVRLPNAEVAILSGAQRYEEIVTARASTKNSQIAALSSQIADSLKTQGWWALGAWYQTFAQANSKLNNAMAAKAQTFGESLLGDRAIDDFYHKVMTAYHAQQIHNAAEAPSSVTGQSMQNASSSEAEKIIGNFFNAPGQRLVLVLANQYNQNNGQTNPLVSIKTLGDQLLSFSSGVITTFLSVRVGVSLAEKFPPGRIINFVTGVGDGVNKGLDVIEPYIRMIVIALFSIGTVLSIYLPMIPFVVWFGGVINWLVVVGEAVIAAPLWAMTHMISEGEGVGNRSGHGYIFLLNVMVRPLLMVVGFFLAGSAIIVAGNFLNQIFGIAIANAQFDSMTGLVSMVGLFVLYCSLCMNLVHRCFNLILIVPDQVINWIGGHAASALGRDTNDEAHRSINVFANQIMPKYPLNNKNNKKSDTPLSGPGIKT